MYFLAFVAGACCVGIVVYAVLQITAHCSSDKRKYFLKTLFNIVEAPVKKDNWNFDACNV